MEEEDTKQCPNCKREIPSINFTTHSVHCARNLRNCPVCKEPVPVAQLREHHDALHKEVPCKKCGESVCGTDLEDHIRDSCAQTIKPCRYCELELPRHALPPHENYCGARSEQCADCNEYVMIKYRQLHLDSNHGFIRLSDDPVPKEIKAKPKPITNGIANPSTSRPQNGPGLDLRPNRPTEIRYYSPVNLMDTNVRNDIRASNSNSADRVSSSSVDRVGNGKVTAKRTNDQPQINTNVEPREKVQKDLPSRGAVKKRPAPQPPQIPANPQRDLPYWSAQKRAQDEERKRQEQTAYNLSVGLPPVLSPAAKLDKLRKMDALHNRETAEDYSHKLRGRVWQPVEPEGHTLGSVGQVDDLSHLRPMTAQQFMDRFQELQVGADRRRANGALSGGSAPQGSTSQGGAAPQGGSISPGRSASSSDRFSEIKSSLRELRRGLNEVTAPYNSTSNATNNTNNESTRPRRRPSDGDDGDVEGDEAGGDGDGALRLPCEFCGAPVLAEDLVLHQVKIPT